MTAEATHWLCDQGVKMMGIDAVTFDPPVWAMLYSALKNGPT
jgi:kynurenine formamidase